MRLPFRPLLATLVVALLVGSCRKTDSPTDPGGGDPGPIEFSIPVEPTLMPSPANDGALPVDRVVVTIFTLPDSAVLGTIEATATPGSQNWDVTIDASVTSATAISVDAWVSLINTSSGTVQFSGYLSGRSITPGSAISAIQVPLVRGPLANVFATGVSIDAAPDTLVEGATDSIAGSATTSGTVAPTIFWTSSDTLVLSVADPTVTGEAAGSVELIASAGTFADTTVVTVEPPFMPVDLRVTKAVDVATPQPDDTITFTVVVANDGTTDATSLVLRDVLDSIFTTPSASVSTGAVTGDSLWTIPTLAAGDSASWTTSVVIASSAGGSSATNTVTLTGLAENDTTPTNDSASVAITVPISLLPSVTITAPADSTIYDPGDLVTFTGTASDPEDGPLTGSIAWSSDLDGALGTGGSVATDSLSTGVHRIVASVTDSDGGTVADTISITVALYSIPPSLNVPYGGTASLPITLSEPAPVGGVSLSVTSDAPTTTQPTVASVFIMQGAQSANATLQGLAPGVANVTVSNPQYGAAVSVVSVTAEFDVAPNSLSLSSSFLDDLTVTFESQGTPIAAPTGGQPVTLTSRNPSCTVATSPSVTIGQGLTTTTFSVGYGGSASLPCQAYVVAEAPGIVPDSVLMSMTAPTQLTSQVRTVGSGLTVSSNLFLGSGNHGGVNVTVKSANPAALQVSPDDATPGADSIVVAVADGRSSIGFYVQGVEGQSDSTSVILTAPGFQDGSTSMTVLRSALQVNGLNQSPTTFSPDDAFAAAVGYPIGNGVAAQRIRPGGTALTVTFSTSDGAVGQLADSAQVGDTLTAVIEIGEFQTPSSVLFGGIAFDPIAAGTTTVTASSPGIDTTASSARLVTVTAPNLSTVPRVVGSGLMRNTSMSLGATNHGGVSAVVKSLDPAVLQLAATDTDLAADSIVIPFADGSSTTSYWVHGLEGQADTVPVVISAPGFVPDTVDMWIVTPAIRLAGLQGSLTTLSGDDPFLAQIGVPSGGSTVSAQRVRPGGTPVVATVSTSDTLVGVVVDSLGAGATATTTIPVGEYQSPSTVAAGGWAHRATGPGIDTISVTAPGFISQTTATQAVSVSAPQITTPGYTVGGGLQRFSSFNAGVSTHGGVTFTVTSTDPAVFLVSPNDSTPGTASIDVFLADGSATGQYYVQGLEGVIADSALVEVSAPGFVTASTMTRIVQPAVGITGLSGNATTLSLDDDFSAFIGIPSGQTIVSQAVRAGGSAKTVSFTTDGPGLLRTLTTSGDSATAVIAIGSTVTPGTLAAGGVAHDPVAVDTATITATIPGFITAPVGTRTVEILAPGITTSNRTVGAGLEQQTSATLGANGHTGLDVVIKSSNPGIMQVSPDTNTPGADSIIVTLAAGVTGIGYYVQGVEGGNYGDATVTISAPGFTDGTATISVVQPAVSITGLGGTQSVSSGDDPFYALIGIPSGNSVAPQRLRPGGSLDVTFTSDNASAAVLANSTTTAASFDIAIITNDDNTPTSVSLGGVALRPVAVGSATVTVTAPGFITPPAGSVTVTINP